MPHTRHPPKTTAEILATSTPDPEWLATQEESPLFRGADWGSDTKVIKQMSQAMLPRLRATLDASRPDDISEKDLYIDIPSTKLKADGGRIRVLLCQPATFDTTTSSPIMLLLHGGGHTVGNPESELSLARRLVQKYHAVVVLPAYRLAPEHKFPSSFSDCFEVLKIVALDIAILKQQQSNSLTQTQTSSTPHILDPNTHPSDTLLVGGTSAGSTITSSINHLYLKYRTSSTLALPSSQLPPITSLLLSSGSYINTPTLHPKYRPYFHSRTQNIDEPPIDRDMYMLFKNAAEMDHTSPIWSSFDQRPELAGTRDSVSQDHVWMSGNVTANGAGAGAGPQVEAGYGVQISQPPIRVYFQVCGTDISRDDSLVYERVLREECGVETRVDLYGGFGHVFWGLGGVYPEMEMSRRRMEHTVEGVGWLIGKKD